MRGPDRRIPPHPIVRLVLPAVVLILLYVAWELVPLYLSVLWGLIPRGFWQGAVIGFLDCLLIAYGGLLFIAVVGLPITACILAGSWRQPGRRRWLSRLVLLDFSLLIGLVGLEVASSAWLGWLHRSPVPPRVRPEPAVVASNLPGGLVTGGANPAARPLRIVVIGESSARGDPYNPWLSVGDIVAWQLETGFPRAADPGGHAGQGRLHPRSGAPDALRGHVPARCPDPLFRSQRVSSPLDLEPELCLLHRRAGTQAKDLTG